MFTTCARCKQIIPLTLPFIVSRFSLKPNILMFHFVLPVHTDRRRRYYFGFLVANMYLSSHILFLRSLYQVKPLCSKLVVASWMRQEWPSVRMGYVIKFVLIDWNVWNPSFWVKCVFFKSKSSSCWHDCAWKFTVISIISNPTQSLDFAGGDIYCLAPHGGSGIMVHRLTNALCVCSPLTW